MSRLRRRAGGPAEDGGGREEVGASRCASASATASGAVEAAPEADAEDQRPARRSARAWRGRARCATRSSSTGRRDEIAKACSRGRPHRGTGPGRLAGPGLALVVAGHLGLVAVVGRQRTRRSTPRRAERQQRAPGRCRARLSSQAPSRPDQHAGRRPSPWRGSARRSRLSGTASPLATRAHRAHRTHGLRASRGPSQAAPLAPGRRRALVNLFASYRACRSESTRRLGDGPASGAVMPHASTPGIEVDDLGRRGSAGSSAARSSTIGSASAPRRPPGPAGRPHAPGWK